MKLDIAYTEPRLVALYHHDNPRGDDTDFYLALADDLRAETVVDLGCGTGVLTRELAAAERTVIGVDPSAAMLDIARRGSPAAAVRWVEGDASAIPTRDADFVVMTGNVAQVFLDEDEWTQTLRYIHGALRPGGHLAFESRNPDDRAWERWSREATYEQIDSPNGLMECWLEVTNVEPGLVRIEGHNLFADTGEVLIAPSELRFRTRAELTASLSETGFVVETLYGDWSHGPLNNTSPVMVFVARRD